MATKKGMKKVTNDNNLNKIVHTAKTVNGEITSTAKSVNGEIAKTAKTVNGKIVSTVTTVNKEIVKTAKTINSQVWGVTKEVTQDVAATTKEWTTKQIETAKQRIGELMDTPEINLSKAIKETNKLALDTTDNMIESAVKNGEKWQKVGEKAVKGGLQLMEKQQDIMFDTLEAVKGQIVEGRNRMQTLFSKN